MRRYLLICHRVLPGGQRHHLHEWHALFCAAVASMREHRRRPWSHVLVQACDVAEPQPGQKRALASGVSYRLRLGQGEDPGCS